MSKLAKSEHSHLLAAAHAATQQGFSVIPLRGGSNPHNAKTAGVAWTAFQSRLPTDAELHTWFNLRCFAGLGIVCGAVSRLIVLDFDDAHAYARFAGAFPHLLNTQTVLTAHRQLPHLYYRVNAAVHGFAFDGGDLRGEGQYVAAPPTAIGSQKYQPVNKLPARWLSQEELQSITGYLKPPAAHQQALKTATFDPVLCYTEQAPVRGRNNALYHAARNAMLHGWSLAAAANALAPIHVKQQPHKAHAPETTCQREREALCTIESAFQSKAYSAANSNQQPQHNGLPNSVREALLSTSCAMTRLLDALRRNARTDDAHTEAALTRIAQTFGIGRQTVLHAIQRQLLPIVSQKNMQCTETNRVRTPHQRGRPAQQYRLPDDDYLYTLLGVPPSRSDPLPAEALRSSRAYRMALHHALVERRPGEYAKSWLAARLGVSGRTIQRYNRALGLTVTPVYAAKRVEWAHLDDLPTARFTPGLWLEDERGKRYPAQRALAGKLLKQRHRLRCVRRLPNHYAARGEQPAARWRTVDDTPNVALPAVKRANAPESAVLERPPRLIRYAYTRLTWDNLSRLIAPNPDWQPARAWLEDREGRRYPPIYGLARRLLNRYGEIVYVRRDDLPEVMRAIGDFCAQGGALDLARHFYRRALP